jgi:hypothetical protein
VTVIADPGSGQHALEGEVLQMSLTPVRRGILTMGAVLVLALVAALLVETGILIGAGGRDPGAGVSAATTPAAVDPAVTTGAADPALATDLDAILAADQTLAPAAADGRRSPLAGPRRLAVLRHLVHGTVVVDLPKLGGLTTVQLDHGTVSALATTSLTIAEQGSPSVTVKLGAETRVRKDGKRVAIGDLATGDEVFVLSKVETDGTVAYLVVVPAK